MAKHQPLRVNRVSRQRAIALAIASLAFLAGPAGATTEIALRFYADNAAAKGATLSAPAQAAVEKAAGYPLVSAGRDADGAFRFRFAVEPTSGEVRAALNRLRSTGAVVYANIASEERGRIAKQAAAPPADPVTALIVRMASSSAAAGDAKLTLAKSGVTLASARTIGAGAQLVMLDKALSAQDVQHVMQRLQADPDVAHVEIDRRAKTQAQPSDPMYATQWNLNDPVGGISAPRAWDITTGDPNAPIAILDTGVLAHPDLAGRVVGGYDFVADARFSNDGDGRDADPSDPGDYVTTGNRPSRAARFKAAPPGTARGMERWSRGRWGPPSTTETGCRASTGPARS